MTNSTCDVVVIGAGPSGSLAAAILQKKGWNVLMLEKQRFPRFVIGESLLPRCMKCLEEADLIDVVTELGFQTKIGARFYKDGEICDFDFKDKFTEGWGWTWQVPRAEFDHAIAEHVASRGVELHYEATVTDIQFSEKQQKVSYTDKDGNSHSVDCKYVIDGSGYGRVIPNLLGLNKPSDFPPRMAAFAHIKFEAKTENDKRIDIVVLNQKLWAWVIPFSDGRASLGFVGDISAFDHLKDMSDDEAFRTLISQSPYVDSRIGELEYVFQPKKISAYAVGVSQLYGQGYVLTGNSTEFLDPVFSSGVTFAMESGVQAAKLVDATLRGEEVDWEKDYSQHIKQGVDTFRSYVMGWYNGDLPTIFFSPNALEGIKLQICSVLAGYVWDKKNPFVKKHNSILSTLAKVIEIQKEQNQQN